MAKHARLFTLFFCIAMVTPGVCAGNKTRWKMASAYPAALPVLGTGGTYLSSRIKEVSNGTLRIKFFDPNKLVPALEIFDAVSTGGVDAGWSSAGMWIGKIPAAPLFSSIPFGPDIPEYLAWIYQGDGLKLWREIYAPHHIVPIPCAVLPPEASGWFRQPITNIDQFKGMKIRFFGLGGKVLQKLGASVQLLAGGDIYPALDRGVLDATEYSMPTLDEKLGFYQIAKHYYFPGWHQQASIIELIVNQRRWDALSQPQRSLLESVCHDVIIRTLTEGEASQGDAIERMQKKGVQIHRWSDQILAVLRQTTEQVLATEAQNNADFAKVLQSLTSFRKKYSKWKHLSRVAD